MPTFGNATNYAELTEARKKVTELLISKGLREGEGKWSKVFARHIKKYYH